MVAVLIYLGLMKVRLPQLRLCYGKMFALCVGIAALMLAMMGFYTLTYWIRYLAIAVLTILIVSVLFWCRDKIKVLWRQNNAQ